MAADPQLLWRPPAERVASSRMTHFAHWLQDKHGVELPDYPSLHRWSVNNLETFWADIAEYFDVLDDVDPAMVLDARSMPGARWFPGTHINFAEMALRRLDGDATVLLLASEDYGARTVTARELRGRVGAFAATLRDLGVRTGDRVAGVVSNTEHAVVAMLGAAAVGAVWRGCSPDFGPRAVIERLGQTAPVVFVAVDGYRFGGAAHLRAEAMGAVRDAIPSVRAAIWINVLEPGVVPDGWLRWQDIVANPVEPDFAAVPFEHPLWILFSSGTTGVPKGIVHGHGGVVLEQLKAIGLHMDVGPADRFFWYTSTAWMMWNIVVSALLTGACAVLYDGSPSHPDLSVQWKLAEDIGITYLGTSAGYLTACARAGLRPGEHFDLHTVRSIGSTGSPLSAATAAWVYDAVAVDVHLASASGGTDIVSGFVGGSPLLPVYAGEISGPLLGVALDAWDPTGRPVRGSEGELVVTAPMPSMPISFWNDPDGVRYRDVYFDTYPGVWRHGDWLELTDRGTAIVSGRSDATLNRDGVRIGTADVYAILDTMPELVDCLLVGVEEPDGYWMPLFVVPAPGQRRLDGDLEALIRRRIAEEVSRRHVPDEIIAVPAVPRTRTGKRLEVPVKRILQGIARDKAFNAAAVDNPGALQFYLDLARRRASEGTRDLNRP